MSRVALLLLGLLLALATLAPRRLPSGIRPSTTLYGMTSATSRAIGCIDQERNLTPHLLSRIGTITASPATISTLALEDRPLRPEVWIRRSPPAGLTQLPERLSRLPQGCQRRHQSLLLPILNIGRPHMTSVFMDILANPILVTAIPVILRRPRASPRARAENTRARAPKKRSLAGDPRVKVHMTIEVDTGAIISRVAGAEEDGEDCSACLHQDALDRTGRLSLTRPCFMLKMRVL